MSTTDSHFSDLKTRIERHNNVSRYSDSDISLLLTQDAIREYLNAGFDINGIDKLGYTPLFHSMRYYGTDFMEEMIMRGADVSKPNVGYPICTTPLMQAFPREDKSRLLLQHKADINQADLLGRTALTAAVQEEDFCFVKFLLEAKAEVSFEQPDLNTFKSKVDPGGWHTTVRQRDIYKLLLEAGNKNKPSP